MLFAVLKYYQNFYFYSERVFIIMKKFCINLLFIIFISLPIFLFCLFLNSKHLKKHFHFRTQNFSLILFGSASMQQLCEDLGDEFSLLFPSVCFSTGGNGSSEAVFAVNSNVAQIGNLSRNLEASENPENFSVKTIALDGIAICSNISNPIKNISFKHLQDIFSGKINNWSQLGGKNKKILLIGRDSASGTRNAFEKILNLNFPCKYDAEFENNGKVKSKIQNDADSIGYISFSSLDSSVSTLKIDGIDPTLENILNSTYHFSHPLLQITKKNSENDLVKAWFCFLSSKKGTDIIKRNRFIPVSSL